MGLHGRDDDQQCGGNEITPEETGVETDAMSEFDHEDLDDGRRDRDNEHQHKHDVVVGILCCVGVVVFSVGRQLIMA